MPFVRIWEKIDLLHHAVLTFTTIQHMMVLLWFFHPETQQEVVVEAQERGKKATARAAELEHNLKNAKALREKELKTAEKEMKDAKAKMAASSKQMKEKQQVCYLVTHCGQVMPHRTWSILVEIMACCLPAISHYLNQSLRITNVLSLEAFTWEQCHRKCSRYLSLILVQSLLIQDYSRISQGSMS